MQSQAMVLRNMKELEKAYENQNQRQFETSLRPSLIGHFFRNYCQDYQRLDRYCTDTPKSE